MTRRNRKCRKAAHRRKADASGCVNKENTNFSNIFCCKEMQNFRIKTTGPTARGCQLNARALSVMLESGPSEPKRKQPRSRKKNKSPPHEDWFENNRMQNFPKTKISSIAFFIPLDSCLAEEKSMDFNDVLYYNSTSSAMLIQYQNEQSMIALYHIPLVPGPQIKYRTSSESSANSEDSVVCFAYDIEEDSLRNYCQDVRLNGLCLLLRLNLVSDYIATIGFAEIWPTLR